MNRTGLALLVLLVAALGWEAWTLLNSTPSDTISETVWRVADWPLVPFLVGVLAGHFFWQRAACKWCGRRPW